jgi:hypothetical protein
MANANSRILGFSRLTKGSYSFIETCQAKNVQAFSAINKSRLRRKLVAAGRPGTIGQQLI